jgi:hypothetical protein
MNIRQERLKLERSIAAVFLGTCVVGDQISGWSLIIPAGEVIRFDRTAPLINRMIPIEWRRTTFGVFPETLLKCTNKPRYQTS